MCQLRRRSSDPHFNTTTEAGTTPGGGACTTSTTTTTGTTPTHTDVAKRPAPTLSVVTFPTPWTPSLWPSTRTGYGFLAGLTSHLDFTLQY